MMLLSSGTSKLCHMLSMYGSTTSECRLATMREDHRDLAEELFGMNLRILRERAGISQSALAAAMTKQGISWHQQTVGRVEAGQQSVRFHEARQLAAILH